MNGQLIAFHIYLNYKGLTTFDFILKYRRAKIYTEEEYYEERKDKGERRSGS